MEIKNYIFKLIKACNDSGITNVDVYYSNSKSTSSNNKSF